ncbi:hypothetical protein [Pontibacter sp. G13]|uniref:hypothetical protein n=1 Tax=Pontibacter sp. G13 TaxID=3074898 RepID=UPI002889C5D5|nr:hypothetical protein [Pontibacter sp. G13]WNJ21567.1 hypothetical protein RJD25_28770 [Pontibacter sp. G13]
MAKRKALIIDPSKMGNAAKVTKISKEVEPPKSDPEVAGPESIQPAPEPEAKRAVVVPKPVKASKKVERSGKDRTYTFLIDTGLYSIVKSYSSLEGLKIKEIINEAIETYLQENVNTDVLKKIQDLNRLQEEIAKLKGK